ncbi:MAG TPA: tetratricopeptide repeat protein [Trebonia sp.]|nr:tetratricopeptide repeat protein [Trebonia sp.]
MTSAAPTRGAAMAGAPSWPVRSGCVPRVADGYTDRFETVPDLAAVFPASGVLALIPSAEMGDAVAGSGPGPGPGGPGPGAWLRSSGKTQLAAAFAESLWQSHELDLLVWIQATSRAVVLSGYAAATAAVTGREQVISCESVAVQFLGWLGETHRRWLLVLDDLADPAALDGLWPAGPAGRVLMTCADGTAVPRGVQALPVGQFNSREALGYLMGRLSANPGQRLGAIDLVSDMGMEPAALTQASAVIASSTMSCLHYRDYFLGWRHQLTDASGTPPSASAVTWVISFERANQLVPGGSVQALLALVAVLDGHGIPGSVLTAPAAVGYVAGGEAWAGSETVGVALTALERVGLLTVAPETAPPTIRVSPVLQAALRAAIPDGSLDQVTRVAADALLQAWPEAETPGWPASGLRSCAATLRRIAGNRLWSDGCHPVLLRAGDSLDRARLTGPAVDHWSDLVTTSGQLLSAGHPHTILAGRRLADACLAAGQDDEAVDWFQRLVDASQATKPGPDHHDVIGARVRLGHALVAARQAHRAVSVLDRALADSEKILGPEHADTIGARDELAAAYLAAGRPADAIALYRRTLADRERAQGSRHPETMTTRQGLADAYLAGGMAKEAVSACKRVVADRERTLGPDHLDTVRARYSLGAAYQRTGKAVAAERVYEQARVGFERLLGPRHPDALRSRAELARIYTQLGRYGDARALLRDTVDRLERVLPHDDPLIIEVREILTDIGEE